MLIRRSRGKRFAGLEYPGEAHPTRAASHPHVQAVDGIEVRREALAAGGRASRSVQGSEQGITPADFKLLRPQACATRSRCGIALASLGKSQRSQALRNL